MTSLEAAKRLVKFDQDLTLVADLRGESSGKQRLSVSCIERLMDERAIEYGLYGAGICRAFIAADKIVNIVRTGRVGRDELEDALTAYDEVTL